MNQVYRPDLGNVVMIGLFAFGAVWVGDRILRWLGKPQWTTSGS